MASCVYAVTRRGDLIAIYDTEAPAVQHACFIEETEHASVKVEIWKRRTSFDAETARKSFALAKLTPAELEVLGLQQMDSLKREKPGVVPLNQRVQ